MRPQYPKRLIEVDLPIRGISKNARAEKERRKGHIPQLHIYPAARPLAACRAVACAGLWLDPVDKLVGEDYCRRCTDVIRRFAKAVVSRKELFSICYANKGVWIEIAKSGDNLLDRSELRRALLVFIEDFSSWEAISDPIFSETASSITQIAHASISPVDNGKPLVIDPFAGGGAIPLEALRVGADSYASDLSPLAVMLNKIVVESIPKFGARLNEHIGAWLIWAQERAQKELAEFYPTRESGETPTAFLWARTIECEGPGCGVQVPLLGTLSLSRKGTKPAIKLVPHPPHGPIDIDIVEDTKGYSVGKGTVKGGSATCPSCGYTTPVVSVRSQLAKRHGGTRDCRLVCVITMIPGQRGRYFRSPTEKDIDAANKAAIALLAKLENFSGQLSAVPDEPLPPKGALGFRVQPYGLTNWGELFTPRQALALITYVDLARTYIEELHNTDDDLRKSLAYVLATVIDRLADLNASLCVWQLNTPNNAHVFGRWALPMVFDFAEVNPLAAAGGSPESAVKRVKSAIKDLSRSYSGLGVVAQHDAENIPLPDDSASALITDPPYYDAIPYASLLDFFIVWIRRTLAGIEDLELEKGLGPKSNECIVDTSAGKDQAFFSRKMQACLAEARRVVAPWGIGIVVFAHKSTEGWEAQLEALLNAGWIVTASWPIDTEMGSRLRAKNSAALASSVHLVCRPRENPDGSLRGDQVGDWRDVLQKLPACIHTWMTRLSAEGVVGADAIFACLGPALEIFSQYSRVEKADGTIVRLRDFLEEVWAAVSKEALDLVFEGADATGFEEDARLSAMWLWTLSAGRSADDVGNAEEKTFHTTGYVLEYDTARKIAQGLGAHMESLPTLVEIKGDKARLLPVFERTRYLFGKDEHRFGAARARGKEPAQSDLFNELKEVIVDMDWGVTGAPKPGSTTLDRVHQGMILFAAGRGEALKRFLLQDGAGHDARFWSLAQSFSALYPSNTDEKRWVDGLLARKKGLSL